MRIIGVIDLKDGKAVHARGGRRDLYAPVHQSAGLVVNGNPLTLARLYIDTFGLPEIYLADLDAIASHTLQTGTIREVSAAGAPLWVDAGIAQAGDTEPVVEAGAQTLVAGLETLTSFDALADICAHSPRPVAFSLDLRGGTPMSVNAQGYSPEEIARRAVDAGAEMVIVLDVGRVGAAVGPDFDLLRRLQAAIPAAQLFAGGGVRGIDDLRQLAGTGCAGALVATAIHEERITSVEIAQVRGVR